jgi:N-acetylmuramoyl-L-alanine amidase
VAVVAVAGGFLVPPVHGQPAASFVDPAGKSTPIRAEERDGKTYLSVNEVVFALDGGVVYDQPTGSYDVKLKGHSAVFGAETPIVVVDAKLVTLSGPVRPSGPSVSAEPDFFQKVIGPMAGVTFAWDKAARALTAHKVESPEIGVEVTVGETGESTKVVFRFSQPPSYRVEKGEDQIVLKFPGARLSPNVAEKAVDGPLVSRVVVKGSEAAVVLKEKGLSTNVYPLGAPPRLVVDVARAGAAGPAAAGAPASAPARRQRTIVLDAGHGGTEEGAKGPDGVLEKDATLALVKTMQETLARRGYNVVTTRTTDAGVGLEDRAGSANAAKADIFLSIHCNASRSATAHGTEVYYLSLDASDRAAAALAEAENRAAAAGPADKEKNAALRDLDLILWDLAQNQHLAASARLAEIIQGDFNRLLKISTRGVKQAPFRVLIGVNAPAVLVEVAFITNPEEERRLNSEEFRREVADTLAKSIETFFRTAAGVSPVPYAPRAGAAR